MSQALRAFAPRFEPSSERRFGSTPRPQAPAFPRLASLVSRAINTLRLLDRPSHLHRIARSRRILGTFARFRGEGAGARAFAYLRTVDPQTFEEVVLSSIEAAGFVVLRNRRYTGDGGVDGRVLIPGTFGETLAVQVKRYRSAINPSHVGDFNRAIRAGGHAGGLLVHCGRTGPLTRLALYGTPIDLVSGSALLNLLLRQRAPFMGAIREH